MVQAERDGADRLRDGELPGGDGLFNMGQLALLGRKGQAVVESLAEPDFVGGHADRQSGPRPGQDPLETALLRPVGDFQFSLETSGQRLVEEHAGQFGGRPNPPWPGPGPAGKASPARPLPPPGPQPPATTRRMSLSTISSEDFPTVQFPCTRLPSYTSRQLELEAAGSRSAFAGRRCELQ